MTAATQTLAAWLLEQIAADEAAIRAGDGEPEPDCLGVPADFALVYRPQALATCAAHRRIVELHRDWPVLVETQPTFESVDSADPSSFAMRASQQIAWLTEQEYRVRFGAEPPTAPMLRALAAIYADRPGFAEVIDGASA